MTKISGFTFVHDAISSGYPIIEAIEAVSPWVDDVYVVDMQSTDQTRQVLERLDVKIIEGVWDNKAGETLVAAHALHTQCEGDIVIHFEADEVYDERILEEIIFQITHKHNYYLAVWRIQLEQNFQRVRWYPELVHRVFVKGTAKKQGHTTDIHHNVFRMRPLVVPITQEAGYLWDITNCFRDNWLNRINKQAELRQEEPQYIKVPLHVLDKWSTNDYQVENFLKKPHWEWTHTPFDLPECLKLLVGVTDYKDSESYKRLMG